MKIPEYAFNYSLTLSTFFVANCAEDFSYLTLKGHYEHQSQNAYSGYKLMVISVASRNLIAFR